MNVRMSALTTMAALNRNSKTMRAGECFSSARRRCGKVVGKGYLHQFSPVFRTRNAVRNKTFDLSMIRGG
jgi:hypothetical protein